MKGTMQALMAAMERYERDLSAALPDGEGITFSAEFEERMNRLLTSEVNTRRKLTLKSRKILLLVAILMLLAILAVCGISTPQVRFSDFEVESFEKGSQIVCPDAKPALGEFTFVNKWPRYRPDGYEYEVERFDIEKHTTVYRCKNKQGNYIDYTQDRKFAIGPLINTEGVSYEKLILSNGEEVMSYKRGEDRTMLFVDEDYIYMISANGRITEAELRKVLESIA